MIPFFFQLVSPLRFRRRGVTGVYRNHVNSEFSRGYVVVVVVVLHVL